MIMMMLGSRRPPWSPAKLATQAIRRSGRIFNGVMTVPFGSPPRTRVDRPVSRLARTRACPSRVPSRRGVARRANPARARPDARFAMGAGEIDKDAAHQGSGDGEEVGSVPQRHMVGINQPEVGLVDQRRGLQRMARPFACHVAVREPAKLIVY